MGVSVLSLLFPSPSWASSPKLSTLIGKVAQQEGLDPHLLSAVVAAESQFDVASVSTRGAVGLMQLMPDTARELGVVNRFNPEQNLRGGARYLRKMIKRYPGNLSMALAAYNAGPSAVVRFGGVPPFPETKRYISKVLGRYAKMVPGRDKSPKRIASQQKSDRTPTGAGARRAVRLQGEEVASPKGRVLSLPVRPVGPMRAPKLVHTAGKFGIPFPTPMPRAARVVQKEAVDVSVIRLTRR